MHRSALLLLLLTVAAAAAAGVHGRARPADGTPAGKFWEHALPGSPMPDAVAELVQKGIDHSPLLPRNSSSAAPYIVQGCRFEYICHFKAAADAAAATGVFFREEEARVGATMAVYFPAAAGAAVLPGILPRAAAASAPFGDLAAVLARFGVAPGSDQAAEAGDTLRWCRAPPIAGERRACATSLEATVGAAARMLLPTVAGAMWAAASALPKGGGLPRQEYAVAAVEELGGGGRHVSCHVAPFPYAVYQCHATAPESSRALVVTLRGLERGGPEVAMVAVCHLDTRGWNPEHPGLEALHTKPGGAPVCHFMPYGHLVFGVKAAQP
ncbi:unnamed protein product [Urochloa decumbens]|uniref:BURP domain-containing protein n=1 Tax=Urochloa decumbens TaxID=240449 RepID=A0ABC9EV86_9POAL